MKQIKAKILSNVRIAPHHYKMALGNLNISPIVKPGQFLHIRCEDDYDPLLRRPFSIHRISDQKPETSDRKSVTSDQRTEQNVVEILYKVVGKGTKALAEKKAGKLLDVIGPLGNGFEVNAIRSTHDAKIILISGGMGVAPLMFLAETLVKNSKFKVTSLIGVRTKELILCEKEFKKLGIDVKVSTEDGSYGYKGLATDLLKNFLSTINYKLSTVIYACGPKPMLERVAEISRAKNIPCWVSLEENMGCGVGVCLGCVVKTKRGYKRVCKDGPVFDVREIEWEDKK